MSRPPASQHEQATRKGWPYYIRVVRIISVLVSSIVGPPLAGGLLVAGLLAACLLHEQATRKGWPYYIRRSPDARA